MTQSSSKPGRVYELRCAVSCILLHPTAAKRNLTRYFVLVFVLAGWHQFIWGQYHWHQAWRGGGGCGGGGGGVPWPRCLLDRWWVLSCVLSRPLWIPPAWSSVGRVFYCVHWPLSTSVFFLSSNRLCGKIQVLRCSHHSRLGEALVVPEEDLLPDSRTQLVWNSHHLHDPTQQWSTGKRANISQTAVILFI